MAGRKALRDRAPEAAPEVRAQRIHNMTLSNPFNPDSPHSRRAFLHLSALLTAGVAERALTGRPTPPPHPLSSIAQYNPPAGGDRLMSLPPASRRW